MTRAIHPTDAADAALIVQAVGSNVHRRLGPTEKINRPAAIRTSTVCNIENGKIDPRLSTVKALADALGVDVDDLVA